MAALRKDDFFKKTKLVDFLNTYPNVFELSQDPNGQGTEYTERPITGYKVGSMCAAPQLAKEGLNGYERLPLLMSWRKKNAQANMFVLR